MIKNGMRPVHPGEVLQEDYLKPRGLSANALARKLHVPTSRIGGIAQGRCRISADMALRLARFFGGDARSWLNMQSMYDLRLAELNQEMQAALAQVTPLAAENA